LGDSKIPPYRSTTEDIAIALNCPGIKASCCRMYLTIMAKSALAFYAITSVTFE